MSNRLPTFSVVTPSYNCSRFIEDAILSVSMQRGVFLEHIVMDGASSDGTVEILKRYPHLRWTTQADDGQSHAINKGFLQTSGDLVGWLNADDYYLPGGLSAIALEAMDHPEADVFYGDCVFVDEHGHLLRSKVEHDFDRNVFLHFGCHIPSTSTFIRRRVIEKGLLLDSDFRVCMDFDYFARLMQAGCVFRYVPRFVAAFRWHGSNVSLRETARRMQERREVQTRFALPMSSAFRLNSYRWLYRGKRLLRKLASGNIVRELRIRRCLGQETLWTRRPEAWPTCESLESL